MNGFFYARAGTRIARGITVGAVARARPSAGFVVAIAIVIALVAGVVIGCAIGGAS